MRPHLKKREREREIITNVKRDSEKYLKEKHVQRPGNDKEDKIIASAWSIEDGRGKVGTTWNF
jgi:hypothetical protein